jgi:hypothetical protein
MTVKRRGIDFEQLKVKIICRIGFENMKIIQWPWAKSLLGWPAVLLEGAAHACMGAAKGTDASLGSNRGPFGAMGDLKTAAINSIGRFHKL